MEFRILGPLDVVHDGRRVAVPGGRERSVLALLLVAPNQVVFAERLTEDLWCGHAPDKATHALRVFVSRLRRSLRAACGDGVVLTRAPGYLLPVAPDALDATRFEASVSVAREQRRRGDHDGAATTLRAALALWRGPALADVLDAPVARAEAARLEETRSTALEDRLDADLACGRHHELVAELDTLTRAHPLRERLWGQRMVALYRSGRQAEALRVYRDLRRILGEGLGLEPSAEVARLEGAILRHAPELDWTPPHRAAPPAVPASAAVVLPHRTPYVGRETQRAELVGLLDGARAGRGALVLIGGEPGVGKTRLTEELAHAAHGRGIDVRVGRCYESAGTVPYVPFVEILEQALAASREPAEFRGLLGDEAPEIAKLLPRLRRLFPDLPAALELPAAQERRFLFTSVADVLARAAAQRPHLLVLDDLHWADEPTLLLLEHLADRVPVVPVVVVATYRDTELTEPLARTFDDLVRRNLARRATLHRLPERDVAAMLAAMTGQQPQALLVRTVHEVTDGNPFFVEEVVRHLAEAGGLLDREGRLRPDVVLDELDVPASLRIVLGRRLHRLPPDVRQVLAAAAVVGRSFTAELLAALGDLGPDAVLGALDEANRARVVGPASTGAAEDRLLFAHELIRQTLLTGLSLPRRRRLHRQVADALEHRHADALDEHAGEIVHHLVCSGPDVDPVRIRRLHSLAGRRAMGTAGFEAAVAHFEQAVLLERTAGPGERPLLYADLAHAQRSLGRHDQALDTWEAARREYERCDDAEGVAQMCQRASQDLWWLNRDREALVLAQQGLAALDGRPTAQRARLLGWTGAAGAWVTPYRFGAELIDEALGLARRLGDPRVLGDALVNKALHRCAFACLSDVLDAGRAGTALLRSSGDLWEVASVLGFMEVVAVALGRIGLAEEIGAEVAPLADRLGHGFVTWVMHEPARWHREFARDPDLGRFTEFARAALDTAGPMGFRHWSYGYLAQAAFLRGDWDGALRHAEEATRHSPAGNHTAGAEWAVYLQILGYRGDRERVVTVLDQRRDELPRHGEPSGYGRWIMPLGAVEALHVTGERARAAALYPIVAGYLSTGAVQDVYLPRLVERSAGIAAAAGERWDAAERHFRTALRQAEELPHVLEGAETRRWYAQMLLDRGRPEDVGEARRLLGAAATTYRRVGMPRHVALVAELRARAAGGR